MVIAGGRAAKLSKQTTQNSHYLDTLARLASVTRTLRGPESGAADRGWPWSVFNIYNCPSPPFPLISRLEESRG